MKGDQPKVDVVSISVVETSGLREKEVRIFRVGK